MIVAIERILIKSEINDCISRALQLSSHSCSYHAIASVLMQI